MAACQPGEDKRLCSPYRSSRLLPSARALPTLVSMNSANRVDSNIIGIKNRIDEPAALCNGRHSGCVSEWYFSLPLLEP